jgi:galactose oxidase
MYDTGKVIYIGGNDRFTDLPTAAAEVIDLGANPPAWRATAPMHFRRQHNSTILPDGSVLVTGGTGGPGFNDYRQASRSTLPNCGIR